MTLNLPKGAFKLAKASTQGSASSANSFTKSPVNNTTSGFRALTFSSAARTGSGVPSNEPKCASLNCTIFSPSNALGILGWRTVMSRTL